jgi:hypothetical protein
VLAVAAFVLLSCAAGLTYFQDAWEFLLNRRSFTADALLQPHGEHIVVFPVAIQQALLGAFGMDSARPGDVVLVVALLLSATLVFAYVRRRLGPWPALIAAVLLLFLGPAWQDLLWPFQISLVGSLLFGVAMLLALDREDGRGDAVACACLVLSVGFSSLGVAFVVGAVVDVLYRRSRLPAAHADKGERGAGWGRAYVALVPLLLYAVWYVGWGHRADSQMTLHNVLVSPRFLLESLSASLGSLLALSTIAGEAVGRSRWGYVVLAGIVVLLAYGWRRGQRPSPRLWPVLASAATFWLLAAFNFIPGREAYSSRYLYVGGAFVLLIAADLLNGIRLDRRALLPAAAIAAAIAVVNLTPLREGRDFFRAQTLLTRSDLAAIEIARRSVDPGFALTTEVAGTPFLNEVRAGEYLAAVREHGSPAYTPAELARAEEAGRRQADVVLANALPVTVDSVAGAAGGGRGCVRVPAGDAAPPVRLRPGLTRVAVAAGPAATLRLRRFARGGYPLEGTVPGGSTALIRIVADAAERPWQMRLQAAQRALLCRAE